MNAWDDIINDVLKKDSQIVPNQNIDYLNDILLKDGKLQILPLDFYTEIPNEHIRLFCVKNGFYQIPTTELIEWMSCKIKGRKTIEIGAGNGVFAEALGIIATDSYLQEEFEIEAMYRKLGQATVTYGKNVKKLNAKQAIKKYKPKIIVANWVTQIYNTDSEQGNVWGVNENRLLQKVDMYIHIGNRHVHKKRILKYTHEEYQFPWLISRASKPEDNVIYVWEKKK